MSRLLTLGRVSGKTHDGIGDDLEEGAGEPCFRWTYKVNGMIY